MKPPAPPLTRATLMALSGVNSRRLVETRRVHHQMPNTFSRESVNPSSHRAAPLLRWLEWGISSYT